MTKTNIEWAERSINATMGCSIVSEGCKNCYAMRMAHRLQSAGIKGYEGTTKKLKSGRVIWTGKINFDISKFKIETSRKKPTRFFVNSMSDLFHPKIPFTFIDSIYEIMGWHREHTFQILTKHPDRALDYYKWTDIFKAWTHWEHVWLGTSVENQRMADYRIPLLLKVPAKVRWISAEPLLNKITIEDYLGYYKAEQWRDGLDWVVVGGESGPKKRPFDCDWARSLRDECKFMKIPFFMKQVDKVQPIPRDLLIREYPK